MTEKRFIEIRDHCNGQLLWVKLKRNRSKKNRI